MFLEVSKLKKFKFPPLQESRQTIKLTFTWCSLLTFLRCIITGMASGSIVLFYNDFNRWHHEYQTRYWGGNQQRLDWQELRWGGGNPNCCKCELLSKALFCLYPDILNVTKEGKNPNMSCYCKRIKLFLKRALLYFVDQIENFHTSLRVGVTLLYG